LNAAEPIDKAMEATKYKKMNLKYLRGTVKT